MADKVPIGADSGLPKSDAGSQNFGTAYGSSKDINSIKHMEGGATSSASPSIGNRETAELVFDVNCPLTPYLPYMSDSKITASVKSSHVAMIPLEHRYTHAMLNLKDPSLNSLIGVTDKTPIKTKPVIRSQVELDMNDGSWGSLFGGGKFRDTKAIVQTETPVTGKADTPPAKASFDFGSPRNITMGSAQKGSFDFPAKELTITDLSKYPSLNRRPPLKSVDSKYRVTLEDEGYRQLSFGFAQDGSITSFSQNLANDKLYPGSESGAFLDKLPGLQSVSLMNVDQERFSHVANLKDLREFTAHLSKDITSGAPLANANQLERLEIMTGRGIKDLDFLANKTHMRSLYLGNMDIDGEDLSNLKGMSELEELSFWNTKIEDAGFDNISGLTGLKKLKLGNSKISDDGMATIANFSELKELSVNSELVTDQGIAKLSQLKGLASLRLSHSKITDEGLKTIGNFEKLEKLDLTGSKISGAGLSLLSNLKNLKDLDLGFVPITDEGLKELTKLDHLEVLVIDPSKMTNAGLQELANCKSLKEITFVSNTFPNKNCNVEGLKELQAKRPKLRLTGVI